VTPTSTVLTRGHQCLLALAIVVAGLFAHANSLENPFVYDDQVTIEDSVNVRALPDVQRAMNAPQGSCASGRPLVALSLAVNYSIAERLQGDGLNVKGYHLFNLLGHLSAALCLFFLLLGVFSRAQAGALSGLCAFTIALLWVLHPLHTAALDHVSYRTETLAALFYLLTFLAADRSLAEGGGKIGWGIVSVLACALGMASKEVMVSAPLIILLWDRAAHSRSLGEAIRRHWRLHLALFSTWAVLLWSLSLGGRGASVGFGVQGVDSWPYLLTQTEVLMHYLRLVFWPSPLVFDASDWPIAESLRDVWVPALVIAGLFAASIYGTWRRYPLGVVALGAFAVLAPTSSFIPITGAPMAEHRMVLPLAALLTLAVLGLDRLGRALPVAARVALVTLCAAALGWLTFERNQDYRSELSIWEDTAIKRPQNARAYEFLALKLQASGELDRAESAYRRCIELNPGQPKTYYNLALLLSAQGRQEQAAPLFAKAQELAPGMAAQQFRAGWNAVSLGRVRGGVKNMRSALNIDPELLARKKLQRPCAQLARIHAVASEDDLYDPAYAVQLATRLLKELLETRSNSELSLRARVNDTLAAAYTGLNQAAQARATGESALRDARQSGDQELEDEILEHLRRYEQGQGFRTSITGEFDRD
jgi:protein O-mannosyl-transferase